MEEHDVGFFGGNLPVPSYINQRGVRVQTTDDTVTALWTLTMPDTATALVKTNTIARETDGTNRAAYSEDMCIYREGGNATLEGAVQGYEIESDAAWDHQPGVSGTGFRVLITGVAATTINWVGDYEIMLRG